MLRAVHLKCTGSQVQHKLLRDKGHSIIGFSLFYFRLTLFAFTDNMRAIFIEDLSKAKTFSTEHIKSAQNTSSARWNIFVLLLNTMSESSYPIFRYQWKPWFWKKPRIFLCFSYFFWSGLYRICQKEVISNSILKILALEIIQPSKDVPQVLLSCQELLGFSPSRCRLLKATCTDVGLLPL